MLYIQKGEEPLYKDTIETYYMNDEDKEYQPYYNVIKWYWETM